MTILFICLGIDAGGTLEVAAEVCRVWEAELVGGLLDRLPWVCVHDPLRLRPRHPIFGHVGDFFVGLLVTLRQNR